MQACNIWDDPPNTCGLLQAPTDNRWITQPLYVTNVGKYICTTAFPRLGFDLLSYPDRLFPRIPPKCLLTSWNLHSTANSSILQRVSDFLALSAWMLLCHVFWTGLSVKSDGEHIGEEPQLYFLSSTPPLPVPRGFTTWEL